MKTLLMPFLSVALVLSACAGSSPVSRSAVDATLASSGSVSGPKRLAAQYEVMQVNVTVPEALRVSEANVFYPVADIVWRGQPVGDRHAQVRTLVQNAAAGATAPMRKGPQVVVDIEIVRFHSVTEKTRYTVGGTHDMVYMLTVRDAVSGAVLDGPRKVVADVKAAGGSRAVAEEQMGRTQTVVVTERLVQSLRHALSREVAPDVIVSHSASVPSDLVMPR